MSEVTTRCGFVALVGRPNVGKSTLLNWLIGEKIALVSHKIHATRKRFLGLAMTEDAQIIFVDTPGLHQRDKPLNKYMMQEAVKAIGDADLVLFLAEVWRGVEDYEEFLQLSQGKPHIVLLTKIDTVNKEQVAQKLLEYDRFSQSFLDIVPVSSTKDSGKQQLLKAIASKLPFSPYLFDEELLTPQTVREIYKEIIREAVFNGYSDELPYESDIVINKIDESDTFDRVNATLVVNSESQKPIAIGKGGSAIKRVGTNARHELERFSGKKIMLELTVKVDKGWTGDKNKASHIGYEYE